MNRSNPIHGRLRAALRAAGRGMPAAVLSAALLSSPASAVRPDDRPSGPTGSAGTWEPSRSGFKGLRRMLLRDLLDKGETLRQERLALAGDAGSQILRRLNARLRAGGGEIRVRSELSDALGNRHIRVDLYHGGYPVIGGDAVIHVNPAGEVYAVGGSLPDGLAPAASARLTAREAGARARQASGNSPQAQEKQAPRLVVFDGTLAYETLVSEPGDPPRLWRTFVDAGTGEVLLREDRILHAAPVGGSAHAVTGSVLLQEGGGPVTINGWLDNLNLYFLRNNTALWGVYDQDRFDWSQNATGDWGSTDRAAVSLARNIELTQRYAAQVLGRNSYDAAGAFANTYVHEGTNYVNAYWDGSGFHFGDGDGVTAGPLTTLDVTGHEYFHAVTQYTSNLAYSYESGALNESFSDIHGALVEFWAQPDGRAAYPAGQDGRSDWMMGEDCWLGSEALRDLRNPSRFGQPSYYQGSNWYSGSSDNGGVHTNSGVQNFAFYLLSEGGTGSNDGHPYSITGLGIQAAGAIALYADMFLLTSGSQYRDAREAWILAATTLGHDAQTVRDVWTACGVLEQVNNLSVSPASLAFGAAGVGSTATLNLAFANSGANATTVTGLAFDNSAFSSAVTLPFTVAGGGNVNVPVRFRPASLGSVAGALTISSNADDNPSIRIDLTGTGSAPAAVSVSPGSFSVSLPTGGAVTRDLTLSNPGSGAPLDWSLPGIPRTASSLGPMDASTIDILSWVRFTDMVGEYANVVAAINAYANPHTFDTTVTLDAAALESKLAGKDLFLMPERETGSIAAGTGTAFRPVLQAFLERGGVIVVHYPSSSDSWTFLREAGLIEVSRATTAYSREICATVDSAHPLMAGVTGPLTMLNATAGVTATDNTSTIVSYNGYTVVGEKRIGRGRVVLIGPDFYESTPDWARVLSNAVNLAPLSTSAWLSASETSGRVVAGQSQTITLTFDAGTLYGGTYTQDLRLGHNDPAAANPLGIPATLVVDGYRRLSASPGALDFGNVRSGSRRTLQVTLSNPGSEATTITGISTGHPEFTAAAALPLVIQPFQSAVLDVRFSPADPGAESASLILTGDAEDNPTLTLALAGAGVPAPAVDIAPAALSVTVAAGDTALRALVVSNPGGDLLQFQLTAAPRADASSVAAVRDRLRTAAYADAVSASGGHRALAQAIAPAANAPRADAAIIALFGDAYVTGPLSTLLNGAGYVARVVTEADIQSGRLSDCRVLVMAHNYASPSAAASAAIETFVQGGGGLVTEWSSSTLLFSSVGSNPYYVLTPQWSWFAGAVGNGSYVAPGTSVDIADSGHPLARGLPDPFAGGSATEFFHTVSGPDARLATVARFTGHGGTWPALMTGTHGRGQVVIHLFDSGDDFSQSSIQTLWLNSMTVAQSTGLRWLGFAPASGSVAAGGSQSIAFTFDSQGLLGGTYRADLAIAHDAPGRASPLVVPIDFTVDGTKRLSAAPARLDFGRVWRGQSRTAQLTLENAGNEATVVSGIASDAAEFVCAAALPLTIEPFASVTVTVSFRPVEAGAAAATLTLASDAEDNPSLSVALAGEGIEPPSAALAPASFALALNPRQAPADRTATLSNSGGDILNWRIASIEQTGTPVPPATAVPAALPPIRADLVYAESNYEHAYLPGRVIVAFKPGHTGFADPQAAASLGLRGMRELAKAIDPATGLKAYAGRMLSLVEIQDPDGVRQAIRVLRQDANVAYAEPDYVQRAVALPNDPSFGQLYGLHNTGQNGGTVDADTDGPEAWDRHTGNRSILIGVIDTGIDWLHPDLAANIWTNPGEIAGNGLDDDGNGFVDDMHGWDFAYDDGNPTDGHYHGTHVAGTIAGIGNNGIGVSGVMWTASLVAIKFLDDSGSGSTSDAIDAVNYAAAMGIGITNNSWGGGGFSQALMDAIGAGGLFVAAAGNSAGDNDVSPSYPASYSLPNIISVAATDNRDALATFSCYGLTSVDLGAPGVNVYSTAPGNSYQTLSGTSMATPHVAGAAGLVWSYNPSLSAAQVKAALLSSTDPDAALAGRTVTGGRLNVNRALEAAGPTWLSAVPGSPQTLAPGASAPVTLTVDPAGLIAGRWTGVVNVATDDPDHPLLPITVAADVAGCRSLEVAPAAIDFAGRFVGTVARADLTLRNDCNDTVTVSSVSAGHAAFSLLPAAPIRVPPFGSVTVQAEFRPTSAGPVSGTLSLDSDADSDPVKTVELSGLGVEPPVATANPASVARNLSSGTVEVMDLEIGNSGGSDLTWALTNVNRDYIAPAPYDASHFVPLEKGEPDARVGRPVTEASGGPDAFGYRWIDSDQPGGPVYQWRDISSTGTLALGSCDDCYATRTLGFSFPFYGSSFTQVNITSNGWVNFGAGSSQYGNYPLPGTSMPAFLVAAFFDDLTTYGGGVYFQDFGDHAIIQYQNVPYYSGGGTATFQIVLRASGEIDYYYENMTGSVLSATTGIQNQDRNAGLQVQYNTPYVKNRLAVRITSLPTWLRTSAVSGTVPAGGSQRLSLTLDAGSLPPGNYSQTMLLSSNNPMQAPVPIPVSVFVSGMTGISRVLRVGPSASAVAAGSRYSLWNLSAGGETRGMARGARLTLYLK